MTSQITSFATPEELENAFYDAVAAHDADTLMRYWSDEEELLCIHPTGVRLTGQAAIYESWRAIFANNPHLTVHIKHSVHWKSMMLDVHSVIETLYVGDETTPHGPMLSTNVFQRGADGWRLIAHHTSTAGDGEAAPDDAQPRTLH